MTDPDARLYKKAVGREARLGYLAHVLMEHRSGLIVNARVTPADGYGERDAALVMIEDVPGRHRITVGGGQGIRHPRLRRKFARDASHPSCRAVRRDRASRERHRRPHDANRRIRDQSAETQIGGARVRVDENDRRPAEAAPPWRSIGHVGLHVHRSGVQHRPPASAVAGDGLA